MLLLRIYDGLQGPVRSVSVNCPTSSMTVLCAPARLFLCSSSAYQLCFPLGLCVFVGSAWKKLWQIPGFSSASYPLGLLFASFKPLLWKVSPNHPYLKLQTYSLKRPHSQFPFLLHVSPFVRYSKFTWYCLFYPANYKLKGERHLCALTLFTCI